MLQSAFYKAYGLIDTTLMRKKKKEEFPVEFAEVELPIPEVSGIAAEVIYPDGKILHLQNVQANGEHAAFIRQVLSC